MSQIDLEEAIASHAISVATLVRAAAEVLELTREEILGECRLSCHVRARRIVSYLAQVRLGKQLSIIGRAMRRDHSTIHSHVAKAKWLMKHRQDEARATEAIWARALEIGAQQIGEPEMVAAPMPKAPKLAPAKPVIPTTKHFQHGSPGWFEQNDIRFRAAMSEVFHVETESHS